LQIFRDWSVGPARRLTLDALRRATPSSSGPEIPKIPRGPRGSATRPKTIRACRHHLPMTRRGRWLPSRRGLLTQTLRLQPSLAHFSGESFST